jgi:tRNA (guanine-N7-)-methyltransferase
VSRVRAGRDSERATAPVAWCDVFGNDRAVEVEIGPGRGDILLAFAAASPAINFGIERTGGAAAGIAARAAERGLANVRLVTGDARCIIAHLVSDGSVSAYHLYFPDPWPKMRHRKRRLASEPFAHAIARTLAPGGRVDVASDVAALVHAFAAYLERAGLVRARDAEPPRDRPVTAFERKYARDGTHHARFVRPALG